MGSPGSIDVHGGVGGVAWGRASGGWGLEGFEGGTGGMGWLASSGGVRRGLVLLDGDGGRNKSLKSRGRETTACKFVSDHFP